MSYRSLLRHRCQVLRLTDTQVDGSPIKVWQPTADDEGNPLAFRCFLDLNFIRKGKDPIWTAEAGRPQDRSGVLFLMGDTTIRSGDRIKMVAGPEGWFEIQGAIDEAWQPTRKHHVEVGVIEVAAQRARAAESQTPVNPVPPPAADVLVDSGDTLTLTSDGVTETANGYAWETSAPVTDQGQSWSVQLS